MAGQADQCQANNLSYPRALRYPPELVEGHINRDVKAHDLSRLEISCPYVNCKIGFSYPIVKDSSGLFSYMNFLLIIHLNHVHFTNWAPRPGNEPDGFQAQCWCGHAFFNPLPFVEPEHVGTNSDRSERARMLRDEVYLHMYKNKGIYAHYRASLAEQSLL